MGGGVGGEKPLLNLEEMHRISGQCRESIKHECGYYTGTRRTTNLTRESFKQRFPKLFTGEVISKNTEVSFYYFQINNG